MGKINRVRRVASIVLPLNVKLLLDFQVFPCVEKWILVIRKILRIRTEAVVGSQVKMINVQLVPRILKTFKKD